KGTIDEVRVWEKALTAEEISHYRTRSLRSGELPDLKLVYNFEIPAIDSVYADGKVHSGKIHNASVNSINASHGIDTVIFNFTENVEGEIGYLPAFDFEDSVTFQLI